jgi:hypothetical protein
MILIDPGLSFSLTPAKRALPPCKSAIYEILTPASKDIANFPELIVLIVLSSPLAYTIVFESGLLVTQLKHRFANLYYEVTF